MGLPWLRLYTEFASDPKIQILAFEDQRHFVMLLCLKGNGVLDADSPNDAYRERLIAKALGLDPIAGAEAKRRLIEAGLINSDWQPLKWGQRQMVSDSSTERVRKFREKQQGNASETLQERPCNGTDKNRLEEIRQDQRKTVLVAPLPAQPPEFDDIRALYPKRAGSQPWPKALKACDARLRCGHTWHEMTEGVRRYQAFCNATGKVGTEYVMQAATFFGPDKRFLEPWSLPANKAEAIRDTNVEISREWLHANQ